jgi:hypothetical protein
VKEAILVASFHENPPAVRVSAAPLFTDLVKVKSQSIGAVAGAELSKTLTVPLVANTDVIVPGGMGGTGLMGAMTTVPPL